jgi:hypothetical protein
MNKYKSLFPRKNTFLAVVHVMDTEQTLRNVQIAYDEGADGIFLISCLSFFVRAESLLTVYSAVRERFPLMWVGINFLDLRREYAFQSMPKTASGYWLDDGGMNETNHDPASDAKFLQGAREHLGMQGLYFGGVAFKHQAPVNDLAKIAALAVPHIDVITTSGEATGKAANLEKIKLMRSAIGDHPLAIASGITPENVEEYKPYTDCFLVASGISISETELDPLRVRELVKRVRS